MVREGCMRYVVGPVEVFHLYKGLPNCCQSLARRYSRMPQYVGPSKLIWAEIRPYCRNSSVRGLVRKETELGCCIVWGKRSFWHTDAECV